MLKYNSYIITFVVFSFVNCLVLAQNETDYTLFTNNIHGKKYDLAINSLRSWRKNNDYNYLQGLKEVYSKLPAEKPKFLTHSIDTLLNLKYELEATILHMELKKYGFKNTQDEVDSIVSRIKNLSFQKSKKPFNSEFLLLKENATEYTPYLIKNIDKETNVEVLSILLIVLENSKSKSLEDKMLTRINKYKENKNLYIRALMLLSVTGGDKSFNYYTNVIENDQSISQLPKNQFLENLYLKTNKPEIKSRIKSTPVKSYTKSSELPDNNVKTENTNKIKDSQIRFIRKEDLGEDYSRFKKDSLLYFISNKHDIIVLSKTAKALGDKYIAKELTLTTEEQEQINAFTEKIISQAKNEDPGIREESKLQIERLWHLAIPSLLKNIESKNHSEAELSAKSLILMRNEDIINSIINQANKAVDKNTKNWYISILTKMKEQRTSVIPNRTCLGANESETLYNKIIVPALDQLKK
jgi:hypothetical protein